mgnify:CR=1 FL=1
MFISTSQSDILIDFDDTHSTVGIKLSGGLDSAIVFYMLCNHITLNKLKTAILPITLNDWAKPYHGEFSTRVIFWMKTHFPRVNILPHAVKQSPDNGVYEQEQDIHLYETHQRIPFDIYFTGINKNPPPSVYLQFYNSKTELLEGPEADRPGTDPISIEHPYFWNTDGYWQIGKTKDNGVKKGNMTSISLLTNIDKKGVAELYDMFDLRQTLMLITRSCENFDSVLTNNFTTHCHTECWWCHERHWGFD